MESARSESEVRTGGYFYYFGSDLTWLMIDGFEFDEIDQNIDIKVKGILEAFNISGFCKHRDGDPNMKTLLEELGIEDRSNEEVVELLKTYADKRDEPPTALAYPQKVISAPKPCSSVDWPGLLYEAIYSRKNINTLARKHDI